MFLYLRMLGGPMVSFPCVVLQNFLKTFKSFKTFNCRSSVCYASVSEQLYLIELLVFFVGLGLLENLIYLGLLTVFGLIVFFLEC